ncbi:MAG: YCF48-related protein [Thermaerobacter sp.]|nr:YCF48-related protein [Thermaerobacter sp.]
MNEREWQDRYRPLSRVALPETSKERIGRALRSASAGGAPSPRGTARGGWWVAAGAVAAALLVIGVVGHGLGVEPLAHPKPQPKPGPALTIARTPLQSIDMLGASDGWAVTQTGKVLLTADGGAAWQDVTPPGMPQGTPGSVQVSIASTGPQHAWVAVATTGSPNLPPARVYYTTDGGRSWHRAAVHKSGMPQIGFLNDRTGFLLLHEGAAAGSEAVLLLSTSDGGAHWQVVADGRPTAQNPPVIFGGDKSGFGFANPQHGWLTGNWAASSILLYATLDGGKAWHVQNLPLPAGLTAQGGSAESLPPVFFGQRGGVLPVRFFAPGQPLVFYQTTDGGKTWSPTAPVSGGQNLAAYSVVNPSLLFVSGGTKVYRSSDGGRHWTAVEPNVSLHGVTQFDFTSALDGWAVVNGRLLRSTDGGKSWQSAATLAQ